MDDVASQGFRLIDVVDQCVVRASPACRYLALSYVWGECKHLRNTLEDNLEQRLATPHSLDRSYREL